MLSVERHSKIIEKIQLDGIVQVDALATELGVSPMTIRRDLAKLDDDGVIERYHGGAVLKNEITYEDKKVQNKEIKKMIAKEALKFVEEDTVVFLDAGTTTFELAKLIYNIKGILVITNDLEIANYLKNKEVELIVLGGIVQKSTGSMLGYYATQMMEDISVDIGFFGAASIDGNFQILTPTIDKGFLKRQIMNTSKKNYLLVDDSKFSRKAMNKVANLSDYTGVITNYVFNEEQKNEFAKNNFNLIQIQNKIV